MNNYDLTRKRIFTERMDLSEYDVFTGKKNSPLSKFEDKPDNHGRTKQMYVGTANDIIGQIKCSGFSVNNGECDRCGGYLPPWQQYGICEHCNEELFFAMEKPFWQKEQSSENSIWFVV